MLMRTCLLYNTQFPHHRQPRVGHGVSVRPVMMMVYSLENRCVDLHKQKRNKNRKNWEDRRDDETLYVTDDL